MTVKMMTGKQVNFLKELQEKKCITKEDWAVISARYDIKHPEDLYHLNVEQASKLIGTLINMPDK